MVSGLQPEKAIEFVEAENRICAECIYLVGRRTNRDDAPNWRCHAKENLISATKDLVTGSMVYKLRFATCYDTRSDSSPVGAEICGPDGKWFKKYTFEDYRQTEYPPKLAKKSASADDLLKALE